MRFRKILAIMLLVLAVASIILGIVQIGKYMTIATLCTTIEAGQTEEAIKQVLKIKNVNAYSGPLWMRWILNMNERDLKLPLVTACEEGNLEVVKVLLEQGADPNQFLKDNWSPLEAALVHRQSSRLEIIEILLANGAKPENIAGSQSPLFIELSSFLYCNKKWSNEEKENSLHVITLLLENGAKSIDDRGNTVIHYLSGSSDVDALALLLVEYPDQVFLQNQQGETPLIWAVDSGDIKSVEYLISRGSEIAIRDSKGQSAIEHAKKKGYTEIVDLLQNAETGVTP